MFRLICTLAVVSVASAAGFSMPQLYAKYSMMGKPGVDSFYAVPRTEKQATELGWVVPDETKADQNAFNTFCNPSDLRICILTDRKGSICGYQISVPAVVDDLMMPGFDFVEKGFKQLTLFGQEMYSNQIFFVGQDVINAGGRDFDGQTGTGLYLQVGEKLLNVPLTEATMNTTRFNRQNCFVRMGQHYFYDIRDDLTPKEFMPWFTLFNDEGTLFGFGFLALGSNSFKNAPVQVKDESSWFEDVSAMAIKMIAPDVPAWVLDYLSVYGLTAHHVYFGDEPWNIKCKDMKLAGLKY